MMNLVPRSKALNLFAHLDQPDKDMAVLEGPLCPLEKILFYLMYDTNRSRYAHNGGGI